jgi:hypothetical protein
LVASADSAIGLPWIVGQDAQEPPLWGNDGAAAMLRPILRDWHEEGQPDLRHLRARVTQSRAREGVLPKRSKQRYRFRRGDHLFEMWFER